MGKSSQRKGRAGELELAKLLNLQPGKPINCGTTPDLIGLPGIHIECKRAERLNISEAMAQAVRDSGRFQDGAPTVFHRRNRETWLVTMRLDDWLELYNRR